MTKSIRLPSAARFAALPLSEKTALFARWLKAQPRDEVYTYIDADRCVLGCFAKVLFGPKAVGEPFGMHNDIHLRGLSCHTRIEVFSSSLEDTLLGHPRTFGAASDRFHAALASE